jgi:hypothetical protein
MTLELTRYKIQVMSQKGQPYLLGFFLKNNQSNFVLIIFFSKKLTSFRLMTWFFDRVKFNQYFSIIFFQIYKLDNNIY